MRYTSLSKRIIDSKFTLILAVIQLWVIKFSKARKLPYQWLQAGKRGMMSSSSSLIFCLLSKNGMTS